MKMDFRKLSVLVLVFLGVGAYSGDYKGACLVSLVFVAASFIMEILYALQARSKSGKSDYYRL